MKDNVGSSHSVRECSSCGICASICGTEAIHIDCDREGFYRPFVDDSKCVECGLCKKSCYKFDKDFKVEDNVLVCNAAWNKDEKQLAKSSSGGVSRLLMEECIARGYKVFGCAYDLVKNKAVSVVASTSEELEQFYGSKYFQSYTVDGFKQVLKDKSEQKYAIFGTPCQIYAFSQTNRYKRFSARYLLVDIFCHGCPSMNLWNAYRKRQEKKANVTAFDKIAFRSKTYGWHEYSIDFCTRAERKSSDKVNDPFFDLFFGADVMNMACYDCLARSTMAYTDIRIGDFWGPKYEMNTKGVSAVIVKSPLGKDFVSSIQNRMVIESADFNEIISAQSYGKVVKYDKQRRNYLLNSITEDSDIYQIAVRYRSMLPLVRRIKLILKSLVKRLPRGFYFSIRKILHSINHAG